MHLRGENKRHCSKLIQGGWINTFWKRWQQAISLNAAGTPRWREIKQVFVCTEPSPLTLPGRISGISCSPFSTKRGWQQFAAVFACAQTLTPGTPPGSVLLSVPYTERQEHRDKGTSLARALETPRTSKNVTCSAPVTCPECHSESSAELGIPGGSPGAGTGHGARPGLN